MSDEREGRVVEARWPSGGLAGLWRFVGTCWVDRSGLGYSWGEMQALAAANNWTLHAVTS